MALAAKIKTLVEQAIAKTDDLATSVTYVEVTPGVYNAATDTTTNTETSHASVPAVLVRLTDEEIGWFPADAIMQKALIAYNDLELIPEPQDYLVISSVNWQVYKAKQVPGNALHILFIRKS